MLYLPAWVSYSCSANPTALVSKSWYHKWQQIKKFKATQMCDLSVLEIKSLRQLGRAAVPLEALGKNLFTCLFQLQEVSQTSWLWPCISPTAASIIPYPSLPLTAQLISSDPSQSHSLLVKWTRLQILNAVTSLTSLLPHKVTYWQILQIGTGAPLGTIF